MFKGLSLDILIINTTLNASYLNSKEHNRLHENIHT